ncbi:hypothetical protein Tco_1559298, partial [Tanacetum coccineum]
MSSMGELTFFLGLQVQQKNDSQDKPDITFAVCACARFQVTPKVSHLHAVKRIFRYLKVIMLVLALIGNPQQKVVNFLEKVE